GPTAFLLAELDDDESGDPLRLLWRRLFELRVFVAAEEILRRGELTAAAVRERLHRIGQVEADEIRATLRKEDLLLPPLPGQGRDEVTWTCFAACWAERSRFEPGELRHLFPTLALRRAEIDELLAEDLDVAALLGASRLP